MKDRETDYRNGAAFSVGLSAHNEELMQLHIEFDGAPTAHICGVEFPFSKDLC